MAALSSRRPGLALTEEEVDAGIRAFEKGCECHTCRTISGAPEPRLTHKTQGMVMLEAREFLVRSSRND